MSAPPPSPGSNPVPADSPALDDDGAAVGYPLLDLIESSPDALRELERERLPEVCDELRRFLLEAVLSTGGHLGSNLGVVELTVALHRVFDFRRDRVVYDTSHQAYPHKVLTGRRHLFPTLRQTGGMCGFTNPEESEQDLFHLGHAGTSISLATGLARATAHEPDPPSVVAVIGDSSLGAGVAFEALNDAGSAGEKLIVVLNDNEWSISRSVGSLGRYLSRIRSNRTLQRAQQEIHNLIASIPLIGDRVERTLDQVREVLRHSIVAGHVFEELGVTYVGPLDGHDVDQLVSRLEAARELDGVVLLHTLTQKGKGHPDAPTHPERVHAAKPPKSITAPRATPESIKVQPSGGCLEGTTVEAGISHTEAFASALAAEVERDPRVHAIVAGMPSGTGLVQFAERFPARFHDVGITEQHGVAMAAGMAKAGLRPVVAIYSTFLQRAYDQVFQEVALQNLPVVFAMDRAGLVGQDGPTHNGVFDIAYLRTLPNFTLCAPRDATDARRMLELGLRLDGPTGIRYPRGSCPGRERVHESERAAMVPGLAEVLLEGEDVVIWAYGALVPEAILAAERLRERGILVGVVDARFAKPLDEERLAKDLRSHRLLITLEEHQRAGGFGSAVLESASRMRGARAQIRVLGIPDRFQDHCTRREEQLARCGIDADGVERTVVQFLERSRV
ncbi:1-deoxy-D-xylulose-5-phosphate synthase [Engelhardtia mirabilis]|uniref:1-deoxy-D-xylulose-5-phosphate synthase n=1 Tax=Engelhardtia mirabilis TaxID=2528011 RepID=A0A518BJU9_9BACT|nr:1-deoxy-D-xylulose-5-phosphate synthase [Planctomycetes bacterium Pla133]QDV01571.1 1-deoxy-D-xylulose-5-phosphate synthase [Planctomycetes bacterium Pla86]